MLKDIKFKLCCLSKLMYYKIVTSCFDSLALDSYDMQLLFQAKIVQKNDPI